MTSATGPMTDPPAWKVLVIDDEEDIREVAAVTLTDAGYRVITAEDGPGGLELCRGESPHIVVTDIRMPGMDGLQVLEAVKRCRPDTEVIVVTAFGDMTLAVRALQLDASDFITKPIDDAALHLALERARERYLGRKKARDYTTLLEAVQARTLHELVRRVTFQSDLIESSMDGIVACDAADAVVVFNHSMERMLDWERGEAMAGLTLPDLFAPGEYGRFSAGLAGRGQGGAGRLFFFETFLASKDGRRIPVQASASHLAGEREGGGRVCFFRDLREMRALEREVADQARILHQDKMISLGKLAASVVHEINNPLAGILNYIRLMTRILRRGPLPDDRRDKFMQYLDLVESETDRCSRIVSGLLDFSRKSPPSFGVVKVDELVDRCLSLSRHKMEMQGVRTRIRIAPRLPPLRGDFNQLQQCLINLVFNAIDAMPEGGPLEIGAEVDAGDGMLEISVTDGGHGIPEADLPHIFEPFFTTKKEGQGVGLGLSTIFGIMQRHDGSVDVRVHGDRGGNRGTTFTLRLPAADAAGDRRRPSTG